MYFNDIPISFVILLPSSIEFVIYVDPPKHPSIFVDHNQHIIEDKKSDRLHFIIADQSQVELLYEIPLFGKYRLLLCAKLLIELMQSSSSCYLVDCLINFAQIRGDLLESLL